MAVEGERLSASELRSLREIEAVLCKEAAGLDRRLRELRVGRLRRTWEVCGARGMAVAACAVLSMALLVAGIRTAEPAVIWAFSVSWTLTLCGAFTLLCAWVNGPHGCIGPVSTAPPDD